MFLGFIFPDLLAQSLFMWSSLTRTEQGEKREGRERSEERTVIGKWGDRAKFADRREFLSTASHFDACSQLLSHHHVQTVYARLKHISLLMGTEGRLEDCKGTNDVKGYPLRTR